MKGVKGKLLNKLKTVKAIGYLKPERILDVNAAHGLIDNLFVKSSNKIENLSVSKEEEEKEKEELVPIEQKSCLSVQEHEVIDVSELMKDVEDDDGSDTDSLVIEDKENLRPMNGSISESSERFGATSLSKTGILSFRPPDFDTDTLFDPNLLAAFKQAVLEVKAQEEERRKGVLRSVGDNVGQDREPDSEPPLKSLKLEELDDPLSGFEKVCPPGGSDAVVLYTTGLRSIRKTFEDCSSIRFLLESFRVLYHERDLSMHLDFRDELFRLLGGKTVPPRLFIKGRYIGGAEEVLRLHEQGKFRPLLAGIPLNTWDGPCEGCAGVRFVVCFRCSGSRKVDSGDGLLPEKCKECNENGLIICPFCG